MDLYVFLQNQMQIQSLTRKKEIPIQTQKTLVIILIKHNIFNFNFERFFFFCKNLHVYMLLIVLINSTHILYPKIIRTLI